MMDYEMFRDVFREKLMSHMPDELAGYSLWADRTGKVNETLDALHLVPPDCLPDKLYPTVYLNHVYEEYKKSGDLPFPVWVLLMYIVLVLLVINGIYMLASKKIRDDVIVEAIKDIDVTLYP